MKGNFISPAVQSNDNTYKNQFLNKKEKLSETYLSYGMNLISKLLEGQQDATIAKRNSIL